MSLTIVLSSHSRIMLIGWLRSLFPEELLLWCYLQRSEQPFILRSCKCLVTD